MQARSRCGSPVSSGSQLLAGSGTLSIPPAGTPSNSVPRRCTSPTPCSKVNTSARPAAVFSPRLWPISPLGVIPRAISSLARAYSMMKIAGSCTDGFW